MLKEDDAVGGRGAPGARRGRMRGGGAVAPLERPRLERLNEGWRDKRKEERQDLNFSRSLPLPLDQEFKSLLFPLPC